MSADPQLCVDYPGQQSVLQLQLSVFSKINVAAVASNIVEGGAWRRNKPDLSDLDFWIPISRNYINSFTESVKETGPEHLFMYFVYPILPSLRHTYIYIFCSADQKQEGF